MENTIITVDDVSADEHLPGQLNGEVRTGKMHELDKTDKNGDVKANFLQPTRSRLNSQSCPDLAYLPNLLPEPEPLNHIGEKEDGEQFKRKGSHRPGSTIWTSIRAVIQLRSAATASRRRQKNSTARTDSFLEKFTTTRHHHFVDDNNGNKNNEEINIEEDFEPFSFVVEPDGDFLFYWLSVVSVVVLYNFWFLIAREAWQDIQIAAPAVWFSLDYVCDFIYILDIIVQLRTGYLEHGLLVKSSKRLVLHYVRSWTFLADIFSLLPTDILYLFVGVHALLRFPRFLKVYRMSEFYYKVETSTQHPNGLRLINLIHILLLLTHWFAAVYFILGEILGSQDGIWSYQNIDDESQNTTARKYLSSFYWSTITLTTIGDIPNPQSNWQFIIQIIGYMMGVFIFATIVGQVGTVIENRNALRMEFERHVDHTKKYMREHKVPNDIRQTVLRWYDHTWTRGHMRGKGDVNTLSLLPPKLRTELALHVNLDTLKKVNFFQECPPEFLHELVLKMQFNIITPGDLVIRKGQIAREMFIIADGLIEVIGDDGTVLATLESGDFFGEIGILNLDGTSNKRTADVRSVGYSELFTLVKEDILELLKDFPQAERVLQKEARKRLKRTNTDDENEKPTIISIPSGTSGHIENMRKSGIVRSPSARSRPVRSHLAETVEMAIKSAETNTSPSPLVNDNGTLLPAIHVQSSEVHSTQDVSTRSELTRDVISSIQDVISEKLEKIAKDNIYLRTRTEQLEAQVKRLQETNEKKTDEIIKLRQSLRLRPEVTGTEAESKF